MTNRKAVAVLIISLVPAFLQPSRAAPREEWYKLYGKGIAAGEKHQYKNAVTFLQEAIVRRSKPGKEVITYGLHTTNYFPYYYLGLANFRLGRYEESAAWFEESLRLGISPHEPDLPLNTEDLLALVRLKSGERAEPPRETTHPPQEQQKGREPVLEACRDMDAGNLDGAKEKLNAVLERDPNHVVASSLLRLIQERETRFRRIALLMERGAEALKKDEAVEAMTYFAQVLGLDAENREAQKGIQDARRRVEAFGSRLEDGSVQPSNGGFDPAEELATARNLVKLQLHERAGEIVRIILRSDPENEEARSLRQEVEEKIAERSAAEAKLREQYRALRLRRPSVVRFEVDHHLLSRRITVRGSATDAFGIRGAVLEIESAEGKPVPEKDLFYPDKNEPTLVSFAREYLLEEGVYRFKLRVTDVDDLQEEKEREIRVTLPFFRSRLFKILAAFIVALGLVGFGIVRTFVKRKAIREKFNPYVAGSPIFQENMFFGREKILRKILNTLHNNSIMVYGERRIGKTSLQYYLKRRLGSDGDADFFFLPVFVDLQGVSEEKFFYALMEETLNEAAGKKPFREVGALAFHETARSYGASHFSRDCKTLIRWLKTRSEKPVRLVFLIDEIDVLNDYSERTHQQLRGIFMKTFAENLSAVLSGVRLKKEWKGQGSPWYNFFDEIEMLPLEEEEARNLIVRPTKGVYSFDGEAVSMIIDFSQGKPYIIQKLCSELVNQVLFEGKDHIQARHVMSVIEKQSRGEEANNEESVRSG